MSSGTEAAQALRALGPCSGGLPTVVQAQAVGIGAQSLRRLWDRPVHRHAPQLLAHTLEAGGSLIFLWVAYLHIFQLSLSILCTRALGSHLSFSVGALSLHFLKGLPRTEVSDFDEV